MPLVVVVPGEDIDDTPTFMMLLECESYNNVVDGSMAVSKY